MYPKHLSIASLVAVLASATLGLSSPSSGETGNTNNNDLLKPSLDRWPQGQHLATDYYPSQWPESSWDSDMAAMVQNNITMIRINEFDWSLLEPEQGKYNFTLLDKTLDLCTKHGLKVILGTPTATPPDWVMQNYDVNFVDRTNRTLLFGSRRHYSLSSFDYRNLSASITHQLSLRYGHHPSVIAWQLDNEFGCHDTIRSYDPSAILRFRTWLRSKYNNSISELNSRQGRVFWSSQFSSFESIYPPFLEVYTTNELHTLDWYEFSSDMAIEFAAQQASIIRSNSGDQAITTNFMVLFTDFDHYKFSREVGLDFVTYDSYPLAGPTAFSWLTAEQLQKTLRTGLPDLQALVNGLYSGVSGYGYDSPQNKGPFGVMEMQPGVLNWNPYRVSPAEGMVKLWTTEVFASGSEEGRGGDLVNFFRWRQVPFAQESTLSGLHLPDYSADEGLLEIQEFVKEGLPVIREAFAAGEEEEEGKGGRKGKVALVFDYASSWTWSIEPYSGVWDVSTAGYTSPSVTYIDLVYIFYSALRRLGLDVDVIGPDQSLEGNGYDMVVVPSLPIIPQSFSESLKDYKGQVIFGPNTGSRDEDFVISKGMNPGGKGGILDQRLPMRVTRVETPPPYAGSGVSFGGENYTIDGREEWVECRSQDERTSEVTVRYTSPHRKGNPAAACEKDGVHYLGFKPSIEMLVSYFGELAGEKGMRDLFGRKVDKKNDLGESVRVLARGGLVFVFNYGMEDVEGVAIPEGGKLVSPEGGEDGKIPGPGVLIYDVSK